MTGTEGETRAVGEEVSSTTMINELVVGDDDGKFTNRKLEGLKAPTTTLIGSTSF